MDSDAKLLDVSSNGVRNWSNIREGYAALVGGRGSGGNIRRVVGWIGEHCCSVPRSLHVSRHRENFLEVFKFLQFVVFRGAKCHAPMVKCADDTEFVLERLVAIKLKILICVGGLSINSEGEFTVFISHGEGVEHRDGVVAFLLTCKFDGRIY